MAEMSFPLPNRLDPLERIGANVPAPVNQTDHGHANDP
jgi:hypothetical protein